MEDGSTEVPCEVTVSISLSFMTEIVSALADAKGNSGDLLVTHDLALGRTIKRNKLTAEMYEAEIIRVDSILDKLENEYDI